MLIEIIKNNLGEKNNTQELITFKMERPKSAKYNLDRYKKSSTIATKFNRDQNQIFLENDQILSQASQIVEETNINKNNKRFQTSKSAYVGNATKLRPQSARHNLEKYRQDVLKEQQLKLQKLQQLNSQTPTDEHTVNIIVKSDLTVNQDLDQDDDLDDLDGLLIREEDSSSELESNGSNPDLNIGKIKNKKATNKKKLLSKRTGSNNNVVTVGPQVVINNTNLPNKTANLNHYTTFRPTAVTINYSTNLQPNTQNIIPSKVVHLHQERELEKDAETILDQTTGSSNISTGSTNSSSSSTSSKLQTSSNQQSEQHLICNSEQIHEPIIIHNKYKNSIIEKTSRDLLNDWLKNDDEIDLQITNNEKIIDENLLLKNRLLLKQPLRQQTQNRLITQQRTTNQSGRTSRFSDFSSNSNLNHSILSSSSNLREKSSFTDPWAKRNPTLIAQNVLMKHKAELEQIRTLNNTSRTSNTPSILTHVSNTTANSISRCLLPDTKYFKK